MRSNWFIIRRSLAKDWRQLLLTTSAIALAVIVLLSFTSVFMALSARPSHQSWMYPGVQEQTKQGGVTPVTMAVQYYSSDMVWRGTSITDVAIVGGAPTSPKIDALELPAAGEYYLSPALKEIVDAHPKEQLADRFGTTFAGLVPSTMLETPDTLLVLRGVPESFLVDAPQAVVDENVYSFSTEPKALSTNEAVLMGVMYTGVAIVLIPVLLLIAISIRVGSAQRAQRYAALRLVGFTKRQVRFLILFESWIAAGVAIVAALCVFMLSFPLLEKIHFLGDRFWPADLVLSPLTIGIIALVTITFVSLANWWGLRKVESSPLGVSQTNGSEKKPRIWSLAVLLVGIGVALFTVFSDAGPEMLINLFMLAVIVTMLGLFFAGPYLTYSVAWLIGNLARSPLVILGTKYIEKHARGVFRSVGGVVLAFFAGSFYLMSVSGLGAYVADQGHSVVEDLQTNAVYVSGSGVRQELVDLVAKTPGVTKVTSASAYGNAKVVFRCDDAKLYFSKSILCSASDKTIALDMAGSADDAELLSATEPVTHDVDAIFALVDTPMAVEELRTVIATNHRPAGHVLVQGGDEAAELARTGNPTMVIIEELAVLAYFGMALTIVVATVSLAVSTVGSLLDRRRSLVTLRLVGVTIKQQKRVVIIESLIPLLVVSALSVGLGSWFAIQFVSLFASDKLTTEISPAFVIVLVGSLLLAIAAIMVSLRFLRKIVSVQAIRSES